MTVDADSDHLSQVMVIRLLLCKLVIFFSFNRKFKFISLLHIPATVPLNYEAVSHQVIKLQFS